MKKRSRSGTSPGRSDYAVEKCFRCSGEGSVGGDDRGPPANVFAAFGIVFKNESAREFAIFATALKNNHFQLFHFRASVRG